MIEFRQNAPMSAPPAPRPHFQARSCRQLAISRLADVICEMQGAFEPVTEEALIARNIPPAVAARYGAQALDVARRRFVKRG